MRSVLNNWGGLLNLEIRRGSVFEFDVQCKYSANNTAFSISDGTTINAAIKTNRTDSNPLAVFVVTVTDAPNGKLHFELAQDQCNNLPDVDCPDSSLAQCVWDAVLVNVDSTEMPLLYGTVTVLAQVTQ